MSTHLIDPAKFNGTEDSKMSSAGGCALPAGFVLKSPSGSSYRVTAVLGYGGFGITYLAETAIRIGNINALAKVAIKEHFMPTACERDAATGRVVCSLPVRTSVEGSRRDFIAEARRLHDIATAHPNIVAVNEVFEANGTAYYVMEFLNGPTLRDYVKVHGPLPPSQTLSIMLPVVGAVAYLHRCRMTHLDIKPDNIIIATDDSGRPRPVLIDFGLSKHYGKDGSPTSAIHSLACSDGYAPVEQYAGIMEFSPTADVYAIGATFLFCLTGRDPSRSTDLRQVEAEAAQHNDSPLSEVLRACLRPSRYDRPADAGTLVRMLDSLTDNIPSHEGAARLESAPTTLLNHKAAHKVRRREATPGATEIIESDEVRPFLAPGPKKPSVQKNRLLIRGWVVAVAVAVIILSGVFVWLYFVNDEPRTEERELQVETITQPSTSADGLPADPPHQGQLLEPPATPSEDASAEAISKIPVREATEATRPSPAKATSAYNPEDFNPDEEADAQMEAAFARATTIEEFRALADSDFPKAFAPLAGLYLEAKNYPAAAYYAKRAKRAGVDKALAQKIIDQLDQLHYYDDPATGGKP